MPSRDANTVTRLAEASWWRDNGFYDVMRAKDVDDVLYDATVNVKHASQTF